MDNKIFTIYNLGNRDRVVAISREARREASREQLLNMPANPRLYPGAERLKKDYPVVFEFEMASGGHAVVATRYTERVKRYRHCENTQTGWFWGKRTKTVCSWKSDHSH